jgi:hypothetical protein
VRHASCKTAAALSSSRHRETASSKHSLSTYPTPVHLCPSLTCPVKTNVATLVCWKAHALLYPLHFQLPDITKQHNATNITARPQPVHSPALQDAARQGKQHCRPEKANCQHLNSAVTPGTPTHHQPLDRSTACPPRTHQIRSALVTNTTPTPLA